MYHPEILNIGFDSDININKKPLALSSMYKKAKNVKQREAEKRVNTHIHRLNADDIQYLAIGYNEEDKECIAQFPMYKRDLIIHLQ